MNACVKKIYLYTETNTCPVHADDLLPDSNLQIDLAADKQLTA